LEDPDVDDRLVLKLILNKSVGGGMDYICLFRIGTSGGML